MAEVGVQKAEIDSELGAERLESLRNEEAELLDKLEELAAGLESRMGMRGCQTRWPPSARLILQR